MRRMGGVRTENQCVAVSARFEGWIKGYVGIDGSAEGAVVRITDCIQDDRIHGIRGDPERLLHGECVRKSSRRGVTQTIGESMGASCGPVQDSLSVPCRNCG